MLEFNEQRVLTSRGEGIVHFVQWSPDGRRLLESRLEKGILRVWDIASGEEVFVLSDKFYISASWSPSGDALALVSSDRAVRVLSMDGSLSERWTFTAKEKCYRVAWAPHGKSIAVGGYDDTVWFLDAVSGDVINTTCLSIGKRGLNYLAWSPDGSVVAIGPGGGTLFAVREADGAITEDVSLGGSYSIKGIAWLERASTIAVASGTDIRIWDSTYQELVGRSADAPKTIESLSLSADGQLLAGAHRGGELLFWLVQPFRLGQVAELPIVARLPFEGVKKPSGKCVAFHPSRNRFAVHTGNARSIRILDYVMTSD